MIMPRSLLLLQLALVLTASSSLAADGQHPLKANLRRSSRFQAKERDLSSSSEDVRREAEAVWVKETLNIPKNISTPDRARTMFGGISGITYDKGAKVYLAVTNAVTTRYQEPTTGAYTSVVRQGVSEVAPLPPSTAPPDDDTDGSEGGTEINVINPDTTEAPTEAPLEDSSLMEAPVTPAPTPLGPPQRPRWYSLTFEDGVATIVNVTYLRNPDTFHQLYEIGQVKPQAIAYSEDRIYVALDKGPESPANFKPLIVEYNRTGHVMGTFNYPSSFQFYQGFTGLTVNPNDQKLYAATGNGLVGDESYYIRITEFDLVTRQSGTQYVYFSHLPNVVGIVSIDDNGGFLVMERSNIIPEYDPYYGITDWPAGTPPVSRTDPGFWFGYNVELYYAICLDALDVQSVTSGLLGVTLNTLRKEQLQEWNNVTKFEAIGPANAHSTYDRRKDGKDRRERHLERETTTNSGVHPTHRQLDSDSIDIIIMTDNEFVRVTETQFLEVDIHEVQLLEATAETADHVDGNNDGKMAEDPAIWVHPTTPEYSFIIGAMGKGGTHVYDINGALQQTVEEGDITSVDVMYSFKLKDDELVDIVVAANREWNGILVYKIVHDHNGNVLTGLSEGLPSVSSPRGIAAYTSPFTGKSYVFVIENADAIKQIELKPSSDNQRIRGDNIRTIGLPGIAGGIVVDQELGFLYVTLEENDRAIIKYDAEPDEYSDSEYPQTIVSKDQSYFEDNDIEGIALYYGDKGDGYLVVSVSGDSTFAIFERESDNEYYDSFTIGGTDKNGIDRVDNTEGVAITNVNLGPEFKCGVFIAQDSDNSEARVVDDNGDLVNANTNFKLVPFEELAEKLYYYLDIDTDSWDPRRFSLVILINTIAQDVYSALNENKLSGRDTDNLLGYLNDATRHTYPRAAKKQQMISLIDPFENDAHRRGRSLEERRQESRRRVEEDERRTPEQRRELKGGCRRRKLAVDTDKARGDLQDFIDRLDALNYAGRLANVGGTRYNYWKDLAEGVKDQLPDYR